MFEIVTDKDKSEKDKLSSPLGLSLIYPKEYLMIKDETSTKGLKAERKTRNLVILETSDRKRLMWGLKKPEIDAVIYPFSKIKTEKSLVNMLNTNGTAVIIKPSRERHELECQMKAVEILERKGAKIIFSSLSDNWYDLRDFRTLISYGILLGFSRDFAFSQKGTLEEIIERNKEIRRRKG